LGYKDRVQSISYEDACWDLVCLLEIWVGAEVEEVEEAEKSDGVVMDVWDLLETDLVWWLFESMEGEEF
jgi:hypothetical protein